jgi:hypothetical protein
MHPLAIGRGNARGLLSTVLQCMQTKVGQIGDILAGGENAEDAALLAQAVQNGLPALHTGGLENRV